MDGDLIVFVYGVDTLALMGNFVYFTLVFFHLKYTAPFLLGYFLSSVCLFSCKIFFSFFPFTLGDPGGSDCSWPWH